MRSRSKQCRICFNNKRSTKIVWPSNQDLIKMLSESNYTKLSKKLGVSDKAIKKHLNKNALIAQSEEQLPFK